MSKNKQDKCELANKVTAEIAEVFGFEPLRRDASDEPDYANSGSPRTRQFYTAALFAINAVSDAGIREALESSLATLRACGEAENAKETIAEIESALEKLADSRAELFGRGFSK